MKELFRREALESFSSHSDLGRGVRAIPVRIALFTALLLACGAIFALWLFFGTIYETVSVDGIIWPTQAGGTVYAPAEGLLSKVTVSTGDTVSAGDIVAVSPREDLLAAIEEARAAGGTDETLAELYDAYDRASLLRSDIDGVVTYIAQENTFLSKGDRVAVIVPYDETGNNRTLTAFLPAAMGGSVTPGTPAQVMPDFAPREEYGYITAYVSNVSSFPVTGQNIKEGNDELFLPSMDERESYLRLEITLMPDAEARSRLKWSTPKSGDVDVSIGTLCGVDIVVGAYRPYQWLF